MPSQPDTIATLEWACEAARHDETVRLFWNKLVDAVNEPRGASPERILDEVRSYGSNSITSFFRGSAVEYAEVAHDTAETLAGFWSSSGCPEDDVIGCERYVLQKMEVESNDLDKIAAAIGDRGSDTALRGGLANVSRAVATTTAQSALQAALNAAASRAMARTGREVATKAAAEVAKSTAKRAAQTAAKKAAQEAAKQAAALVAKRLLAALNIVVAAWTVIDLAGPAKRVTIPAVTFVALLRQLHVRSNHFATV
jgi:uncharacterized protein YaaW (UPF0174 family)